MPTNVPSPVIIPWAVIAVILSVVLTAVLSFNAKVWWEFLRPKNGNGGIKRPEAVVETVAGAHSKLSSIQEFDRRIETEIRVISDGTKYLIQCMDRLETTLGKLADKQAEANATLLQILGAIRDK